jgi:hypothetical protein
MSQVNDEPGAKAPPAGEKDVKPMPGPEPALRKASEELKDKIAEAKRRQNMPLDSALGNPDWEARAADGRFDLPEKDDD